MFRLTAAEKPVRSRHLGLTGWRISDLKEVKVSIVIIYDLKPYQY
jgi:hypothetical protein